VLGNKLIAPWPISAVGPALGIAPLSVEGGIFAFLLLVITASAVAELHGRTVANQLVRFGFVPLIASMLLIRIILVFPPAAAMAPDRLAAYGMILGQSARLMFAGLIAYGTSQTFNVTIFSALKGREGGRLLWLRAGIASMASQVIDTLLFVGDRYEARVALGGEQRILILLPRACEWREGQRLQLTFPPQTVSVWPA